MASFPVEVLLGLYLGVLTGIVPALVAWGFGFAFKYITGVTVPALGVDVSVSLDERASATVNAAPPLGGLSKRIPSGKRGVSLRALLPTGTARGDDETLSTPDRTYEGTVVSLRSDHTRDAVRSAETDGGTAAVPTPPLAPSLPVADGGDGRITVAVDASQSASLLGTTVDRLAVESRGTRREYELLSLLRQAGNRIRKVTIREGSPLAQTTIGDAAIRDSHSVTVLAVKHDSRWQFAPRGSQALVAGDDLFVVGTYDAVTTFREVVA